VDKFVHRRNLKITREAAFNAAQQQMFKALSKRIMPLFSSGGVITDLTGSSVSSGSELKVTRTAPNSNTIRIGAGSALIKAAIPSDNEIIYLEAAEDIDLSSIAGLSGYTGFAYVSISPKEIFSASERIVFTPGAVPGERISTMINDSALVSVTTTMPESGLLLARLAMANGALLFNDTETFLKMESIRPFIDSDDDDVILYTSPIAPVDGFLQIENEIAEYSGLSAGSLTLTSRGDLDSDASFHKNGCPVLFSPIVDLRQQNICRLKGSGTGLAQAVMNGIVNFNDSNGDRFLVTRKVPDIPNTPDLKVDNLSLVWLNRQTSGGDVSRRLSGQVGDVKALKGRVEMLSSNIAADRSSLSGAEPDEAVAITQRIEKNQGKLVSAQVSLQQSAQVLNNYASTYEVKKKYVVACLLNQPELIDQEQIVKYEALVHYASSKSTFTGADIKVPSQIFSSELIPSGITAYGDNKYDYDGQPGDIFRTLLVPISSNEKVKVKVRSITESGMVSEWSPYVEYEFNPIDSSEIQLAIDLENLKTPQNPYLSNVITEETIALISGAQEQLVNSIAELRSTTSLINSNSQDIITNGSKIDALEARLRRAEVTLGVNSNILETASTTSTQNTE